MHVLSFRLRYVPGTAINVRNLTEYLSDQVVVALAYIVFYLIKLDGAGLQLYIILTPRTHLCGIVYIFLLGLYYVWYLAWDSYAQRLLEES